MNSSLGGGGGGGGQEIWIPVPFFKKQTSAMFCLFVFICLRLSLSCGMQSYVFLCSFWEWKN